MTSTTMFTNNYVVKPNNFKHGLFTIFFSFLLILAGTIIAKAQSTTKTLPDDEVQALHEIAEDLNKKDWNFNDPCSNIPTVEIPRTEQYNNTLVCNCSFPANVCHIESLFLTGQDLDGVLPRALAKLSHLKNVNLGENYLSGSIPSEWASTKLEFLVLSVNRLSGPIPHYLGNITTLSALALESNMFSGTVPAEFGNLVNMEILYLSANNLTGQLPTSISNLTKLRELRISSNNFTGRIPDYIGSWKQLRILEMEASGFEGPIPLDLSLLNNLTELRISDVYGESSKFPDLRNMKGMKKLMLRNSNISGRIPEYISTLTSLQTLDLTFNKLEGDIPNFGNLMQLSTIYLTGNVLSGSIPGWIKSRDSRYQIDLSYNNFDDNSVPTPCRETFNLFKSSPEQKNLTLSKCLNTCAKDLYSLHINCGGKQTTIDNINYEADEDPGGAAKFVRYASDTWGFSSTGDFWDVWSTQNDYIATNISTLRMNNSVLYTTARLSPLSLTYYARCLGSGNYTVKLHFAETVLRDNRSYYGVGRRLFDVYIQGELKLKEYNIEKEANGVDKEKIKIFKTVPVDKSLEIRFQWAGKGTTNVPRRGVYGVLISAISVKSEFEPPGDNSKRTVFIVIGSVASLLSLIFLILFIAWRKGYLGRKVPQEGGLTGHDLQTGFFTFRQIKSATNNFDASNKLGEGGFGAVYKGILSDGTTIAVKQLSFKSKQGSGEFVNEIGMISALNHPNIVKLYGCCIEGKHLLLVYEYMENNSLSHLMFGPEEGLLKLDWPTRRKICVGIARGLAFLHEESILKIVHRDIKAANILLDKELNPKISDFGLARLHEEEHTHISTRIAGTIGYMAPEYALWGYLTDKVDVYSFGVVALELVAGKNNTKYRPDENYVCLLDWALHLQQQGNLMEIVDPNLIRSSLNKEEAVRMIKVALLCTNPSPGLRPSMSTVVNMLIGQTVVHEVIIDQSIFGDQMQFNTLRKKSEDNSEQSCGETQSLLNSSDTIWKGSTSSTVEDIRLNNFHTL